MPKRKEETMENMEKIRLKDGTEYCLYGGSSENTILIIITEDMSSNMVYDSMTVKNLSYFNTLNTAGEIASTYTNKEVASVGHKKFADQHVMIFNLSSVDPIRQEINSLTEQLEEEKKDKEQLKVLLAATAEAVDYLLLGETKVESEV